MSKKRLTFKQIEKKSILLESTKQKITGHNRKEISKIWENYRGKKFVIEELPKYRQKLSHATPEKKELLHVQYFDKKEIAQRKLEFGGLQVEKKVRQKYSESDYYKVRKGDLENTVQRIFDKGNIRYVMVTLKIRITDEGLDLKNKRDDKHSISKIMYVSDVFTPESFEDIMEMSEDSDLNISPIIDKIMEKLSFVAIYKGFEIISKHIRIIYATPEKTTRPKKQ